MTVFVPFAPLHSKRHDSWFPEYVVYSYSTYPPLSVAPMQQPSLQFFFLCLSPDTGPTIPRLRSIGPSPVSAEGDFVGGYRRMRERGEKKKKSNPERLMRGSPQPSPASPPLAFLEPCRLLVVMNHRTEGDLHRAFWSAMACEHGLDRPNVR